MLAVAVVVMVTGAIVMTSVRAVAVSVMVARAIVVTGMWTVTMAAVINSVIVVTTAVSRRVRGMMTMSVAAAFERGHHRRRHSVVAQLE